MRQRVGHRRPPVQLQHPGKRTPPSNTHRLDPSLILELILPIPPPQVTATAGVAFNPQGTPQVSGQECWRCGQPGHFHSECPHMEVGQVVQVAGPPTPSPGPGGTDSAPVRIQGGKYQAMVDSGCTQSIIHQNLV